MKTAIINKVLIFLITSIRPLFGPAQCRFTISCTKFAALQLQSKSFFSAIYAISKRVISCNPIISK